MVLVSKLIAATPGDDSEVEADESQCALYLSEANEILSKLPAPNLDFTPLWESETFEGLRWFEVASDTTIDIRK